MYTNTQSLKIIPSGKKHNDYTKGPTAHRTNTNVSLLAGEITSTHPERGVCKSLGEEGAW